MESKKGGRRGRGGFGASRTQAEGRLWRRLHNRQLNGFKFVRQEPIGRYFADFACRECKLVIEIDGATHSTDAEINYDRRREASLIEYGFRVLRFNNNEVYQNLGGVLETILAALETRTFLD